MRSTQHLLFATVLLATPLLAAAGPRYAVSTIAGAGSYAYDINNAGQVVGTMSVGDDNHAFLATAGVVTDIGSAFNGGSIAMAINEQGQVVGGAGSSGFLYSNGVVSTIPQANTARGINNAGAIVGQSTFLGADGAYVSEAYVYANGKLTVLGALPAGDSSRGIAINNAGDVVGAAASMVNGAPDYPTDSFLYHNGTMTSLGNLGGVWSGATSINDHGQIVGYSGTSLAPDGGELHPQHAFLYDAGGLHDLGGLAPHWNSWANDVNNVGQIVGGGRVAAGMQHGFVYEDGGLVDLNLLIDPASGWTIKDARAINDMGQIVGWGCKGDICQAVRLDLVSAVPEPSMALQLLAGLPLPLLLRRRRALR